MNLINIELFFLKEYKSNCHKHVNNQIIIYLT